MSSKARPVPISQWVGASPLLAATARWRALARLLAEHLPAPLREHCWPGMPEGKQWVLLADSPVWAARLRLELPTLAAALAPALGQTPTLRVRVGMVARGGSPTASAEP
jgi:hypothetical protein